MPFEQNERLIPTPNTNSNNPKPSARNPSRIISPLPFNASKDDSASTILTPPTTSPPTNSASTSYGSINSSKDRSSFSKDIHSVSFDPYADRDMSDKDTSPLVSRDSSPYQRLWKKIFSGRSIKLAVYLSIAVLLSSANSITWKRTLNSFRSTDGSGRNLEFFVTQWTVFLYVALAWVIMMYRWWFTDLIDDNQKQFPRRKFVFMGFLDAGAGVTGSIGGAFVSGQLQNLLNQGAIPATMLMSRSFLGVRYTWLQYLGATFILCGALFAAYPSATGDADEGTTWYGLAILVFSLIPGSFSNVYKEANLKTERLDVFYLTTVVSWYQVLVGFAFCPLLSLPGFGGIRLSQIPSNMVDGWHCFLGRPLEGYDGCSATPGPWFMLLVYVVVNFVYNTLLLLITKHGSAVLLVIASALSLPMTNFIFTFDFIMGDDAEVLDVYTMCGLVLVVLGFLLYSLVSDPETGEIQIIQGPAGQMAFITEDPPLSTYRRRSFDLSDSPSVAAARAMRREKALQNYYKNASPYKPILITPRTPDSPTNKPTRSL